MFVVNPNEFLLPSFGITPFKTEYIAINHLLQEDNFSQDYFDDRFGKENWSFTFNGREAIKIALEKYQLDKNDLVTILTTSENFYISSCVTLEIDAVCKWNREILPETKLIFVNHEFGYPHPDMERLVQLGLPIIEDCCTTFFSQNEAEKVGKYGDFTVYSLPKFFPIQIGGIVVSNKRELNAKSQILKENEIQYIKNVLSFNLKKQSEIIKNRKENFNYGLSLFTQLGFTERFLKNDKIVPSTMLLNNNGIIKDLNALKLYLSKNGIQSSVFYGEDAFFIPNHQSLSTIEIDFLFEIISFFIKNQ
jgi:hypothetical protein